MIQILQGDCREVLKALPDESVQCVVTSPPYWGLRDYGTAKWEGGDLECDHSPDKRGGRFATPVSSKQSSNAGSGTMSSRDCPCGAIRIDNQIGLEKTPQEYVATIVQVFREVRRVLKTDGTCWLNLGDSYASAWACNRRNQIGNGSPEMAVRVDKSGGLKEKDLVGIPWRVAFALQEDGWWLRSDIIWAKPNPMPESVTDRPTRAHEYIFLLTKNQKYFYDAAAIREPASESTIKEVMEGYNGHATKDYEGTGAQDPSATKSRVIEGLRKRLDKQRGHSRRHSGFNDRWDKMTADEQRALGANKRSVWTVAPANYKDAHFATFPPALISPCILAGSRSGDTVLDPFGGSGTTGQVALGLGRKAILIELNPEYHKMIEKRTQVLGFQF